MDHIEEFGYDISSLKAYSGYLRDREKLKASASGGIATAIAEQFIIKGGIVFGVKYSDDFRNSEFCIIDNTDDLDIIKGSKYIKSRKEVFIEGQYYSVYKLVADKLSSGFKVLFIGLGCDVAALRRTCEIRKVSTDTLYTVDLVCHGPTSPEVARQFLDRLENKYNSKITDFTLRYKKKGWVPSYIRAVFESGRVYEEPFYDTDYGKAFTLYSGLSCYECKFRGSNHLSDITVGDYWGMEESEPEYNKYGVSVAFLNDPFRGKELIDMIDRSTFYLQETDTLRALRGNVNYYSCREKNCTYQQFEYNLKTKGLHYAVLHSDTLIGNILSFIKMILRRVLPAPVITALKRLLKR